MDKKILQQLEEIQQTVTNLAANMVTKADAKKFLTKDDAKNNVATFATKDDLKKLLTKDDAKNFLTKADAKHLATKNDLNMIEKHLSKEIKDVETSITLSADKHKAEKEVVDDLEKRVLRIEHKLAV